MDLLSAFLGRLLRDSFIPKMNLFSLPYAIPDECVVPAVPPKHTVLSAVVPGTRSNYTFAAGQEEAYYQQYRDSRFALSPKKGGWDCLRHYEVLAAGCVPLMDGLEYAPRETMVTLPKALLLEARTLWPWSDSYEARYHALVERLLDHVRTHCTTSALASYFLGQFSLPDHPKVLMINCHAGENYTRELLTIALRRRLGADFVETPRNDVLYKGADLSKYYGNGFTYGGRLDDLDIDRSRIEERLAAHAWDLVIFGKNGRDDGPEGHVSHQPYFDLVVKHYKRHEIVFLFGGDGCQTMDSRDPTTHWYTPVLLAASTYGACAVRELDLRRTEFTNDWFDTYHIQCFERALSQAPLPSAPRCLEIGSFEGRSALWLAQRTGGVVTCIDTWEGSVEHSVGEKTGLYDRFMDNTWREQQAGTIVPLRGTSLEGLCRLVTEHASFHLIYVDGSHTARDVLADAVLAFNLLAPGGLLLFDDYTWGDQYPPVERPQLAIDSFMKVFEGKYSVAVFGYVVALIKR